MKAILILMVLVVSNAYSGKVEYCQKRQNPFYFQNMAFERENRLSFVNDGGAFDAGVCWWHSRFQRSALYLTIFNPADPRPTKSEAKKIIKRIKQRKAVVTVPGYRSLREFSLAYDDLIQKELEGWQIGNTLIFRWIAGLTGVTQNSPDNMAKRMRKLFRDVTTGKVVYQKLQLKGIAAHAWLVVGIKFIDGGYQLQVIDSNYSYVKKFYYYYGDPGIYHAPYGGYFVPYTEQESELKKLNRIGSDYCS